MDRQLDISSVLQGGYATPLTRELQAERHLTKQVVDFTQPVVSKLDQLAQTL